MKIINTKLTLAFFVTALILLVAASALSYIYSQGLLAPLSNLWNILLPIILFLLAAVLVLCLFLIRAVRKSISTLTQQIAEHNTANELYNSLANSPAVGIYIVQDKKFVFVNTKFQSITGYSEEELLSTDSMKIVCPEDRQMVRDNAVAMLKGKSLTPYEFKIVHKNGELIWTMETVTSIQYNGRPATLSNVMDITERIQAEEKLRESEEKLRKLMESVPVGICITTQDGRTLEANSTQVEIFRFESKEDYLKMPVIDAYNNPEDRKRFVKLANQGFVKDFEVQFKRKDGEVFWASLTAVAQKVRSNQHHYIVSVQDITERKKAQEELETLFKEVQEINQRLEQSNRELEDFAYVASHDLQEPLRKISSFSEILQASLEGRLDEDELENLSFVIDGAQRMQSMIDDLLTYSRITTRAKPFQTVDLNDVIENLKNFELSTALKETEGTIHIPEPLLAIHGDPSQIHQLLQNLISNGLKFHQDGIPPLITISSHPIKNNFVHFSVQDNGIGINEEHYEQIFIMFKRLHSRQSYQGTGIGLATCKKIVERHGGQIGVKSNPGEGSTFWFTMPSSVSSDKKRSLGKPEPETVTTH